MHCTWLLVAIRTTFFSALLLSIPLGVLLLLENLESLLFLKGMFCALLSVTLAIIFVKHYADRYNVKLKNLWSIPSSSSLWGVLLIGTCGAIFGTCAQLLLEKLIWPITYVETSLHIFVEPYYNHSLIYRLLIALFIFAFAASEELIFRGFLQTYMKKYMNRWNAIILSSLFFTILHLPPQSYPYILAMGVTFGIVFELSGTIWAPILAHGLGNVIGLMMF